MYIVPNVKFIVDKLKCINQKQIDDFRNFNSSFTKTFYIDFALSENCLSIRIFPNLSSLESLYNTVNDINKVLLEYTFDPHIFPVIDKETITKLYILLFSKTYIQIDESVFEYIPDFMVCDKDGNYGKE